MNRMRAYRVVEWGRGAELVELDVPEPGPGQIRVKVAGCGLCHSDLVMPAVDAALGEGIGWRVPFTLGHETAGWVDALGKGVELGAGVGEGTAVALISPSSCGVCRWCTRGQENACPHGLVGRGYGRDGGLADYVLVDDPPRSLVPLDGLDPRAAGPLTDAGATSHHAVRRVLSHLDTDSTVVVVGIGGLGSYVVQLLRALSPARIVAVDRAEDRRAHAIDLGADHAVDGVDDDTAGALGRLLGADPVDAVVDVVGSDETIGFGAGILAAGGALAVVGAEGGTLRRPWFGGLPRDGEVFTFQGSDPRDARAVIELAAAGSVRIDVDPFPLDRVVDAYAALEAGKLHGRAVVRP